MFKKNDYIILSVICFFLGLFIYMQYRGAQEYSRVIQPETNAIVALEVSKLTKTNANLRQEVRKLTTDLDTYKNSSASEQELYQKYLKDTEKFDIINGEKGASGRGIKIIIEGQMLVPQMVDLVNAIKNIGSDLLSINGQRILLTANLVNFAHQDKLQITVLGNSKLLKSAIERKGGIVEQISTKEMKISIEESEDLSVPAGAPIQLIQARIIND